MKGTCPLAWALALAVLAPATLPALAAAESNAVLYEVTENLKLRPLLSGRRLATATLSGTVEAGNSVCPGPVGSHCVLTATATDHIDLKTGNGPVTGKFRVQMQDQNPVDGAELTILEGTITGHISLAPALFHQMPLGTLQGRWSAHGVSGSPMAGVRVGGTLSGVFRLPFVVGFPENCEKDGDPSDCLGFSAPMYLTDTGPVEVAWNELSVGMPTVRLEITFADRD